MMAKKRGKTSRGKHSRFRKTLIVVFSVVAALALSVAVIWYVDNKLPAFNNSASVYVYPGMTYDQFMTEVFEKLQPRHPMSVRRAMMKVGVKDGELKVGHYFISKSNPAILLARSVKFGWQSPVKFVLEGRMRRPEVIAKKISSQMLVDSAAVMAAFEDSLLLEGFGFTPSRLFEMIIPDTYQAYWNEEMPEILSRLKKGYDAYWTEERLGFARKQGLSPSKVSVLASIVAEESNCSDDLPLIASVYLNRLRKGMKLQASPTVCYIYDYELKRVLYKHLKTPSPYNTFIHTGLPPTPICVPPKSCLEAVLHPAETDYLYFCADPSLNGRSRFTTTYGEHQRNAKAYSNKMDTMGL